MKQQMHSHADGTVHSHEEAVTHSHPHTNTKAVLNRLSKAIGHLEAVRQMVENGRDCPEVLVQLAAVRAALASTGRVILKDHIEHCIVEAAARGDSQAILELGQAIDQFMK